MAEQPTAAILRAVQAISAQQAAVAQAAADHAAERPTEGEASSATS